MAIEFQADPEANHEWEELWKLALLETLQVQQVSVCRKGYVTLGPEHTPWDELPQLTGTVNCSRDAPDAFKHALDAHMLREEKCRQPTFWVDGSTLA